MNHADVFKEDGQHDFDIVVDMPYFLCVFGMFDAFTVMTVTLFLGGNYKLRIHR